ncbi:hypothetical protein J4E90_001603 [Alternaria incomplexa]|uniref:uncharacterized protein n=1 Tax=Alternaria incomplexa TaxID=1187928 RepID=UPI00221FA08D|nr:uncharacterized protein J4E90_001603 [Alternaria incomplexa]KAI4919468.1 hypothetical protein J4E90_001603 [Alternaria incomplexa]
MYKDEEGNFNGKVVRGAASRVGPREARQHENTPSRSSIPEENSRWRDAEKFVAWKFGGQRYDERDQVLLLAEDKPRFKKSGRGDIPDSDSDYHRAQNKDGHADVKTKDSDLDHFQPNGNASKAGRPWKKEGSDEDGVDMDDIKKQVELIAREFGNVRNVVHVDTVHDEMRLIFRIEFDSIDAAQRAIQSLRRTPVIRMFVNAPKAYSKRKDIPDVTIRTGRDPATDPTIELVRTRSQPQRGAHLERDRNRNVERIYNAMVSGDHARDNPKSTARKRWIEEPHYQSDFWEIARGRTRKVTVYEW